MLHARSNHASRVSRLRRSLVLGLASLQGLGGLAASPWACAGMPGAVPKRVTLIVPYPAGGATDAVARAIAQAMAERLGATVLVENRPGAGGQLGMAALAQAQPDGSVIGIGTVSTLAVLPAQRRRIGYEPQASFVPVAQIAAAPMFVAVPSLVGVASLGELLEMARRFPGMLNYGSVGEGSVLHLVGLMVCEAAKVRLVHVPYVGTSRLNVDLIAGRIHVAFDQLAALPAAQLASGELRLLAVMSDRRTPLAPDVPTVREAGLVLPPLELWSGLLAPADIPSATVARLNEALNAALADPGVVAVFRTLGLQAVGGDAQQFERYIDAQMREWGERARRSGLSGAAGRR